ncbi:MAG: hypothetical protein IK081_09015 [Lachnospiraceae bacterium]|nr:hypothetical protein [Lachnospiraceae bacterium]
MAMTNNWGDDIDDELKKKEKLRAGFTWNFISTNVLITRFDQEVGESDENYPKYELSKMWYSTLVVMLFFEIIFHSVICIVALPFFFLYGMILIKIARLFKRFGYSTLKHWIVTIIALIAGAAANYLIWFVLPGM